MEYQSPFKNTQSVSDGGYKSPFGNSFSLQNTLSTPETKKPVLTLPKNYLNQEPAKIDSINQSGFQNILSTIEDIGSRVGKTIGTAAINLYKDTVSAFAHPIDTAVKVNNEIRDSMDAIWNNWYQTTSQLAQDLRDPNKKTSDKIASSMDVVQSVSSLIFSPISETFNLANKIPGINIASQSLGSLVGIGADIIGPMFKTVVESSISNPELRAKFIDRADQLGQLVGSMTVGALLYTKGEQGLARVTGNDVPNMLAKANTPESISSILTKEMPKLPEADKPALIRSLLWATTRDQVKQIMNDYVKSKTDALANEVKQAALAEEVKNQTTQTPTEPVGKEYKSPFQQTPETTQTTQGLKPSKIGLDINEAAIEAGLTKGFSEVAGYDPVTIKEQARLGAELLRTGVENMSRVLKGEAPLPEGLKGAYAIKIVEDYLNTHPNTDLFYDLANSPYTSATSEAGQTLRLTAERNPNSPVSRVIEAKKFREEKAQRTTTRNIKDVTTARQAELKRASERVNLTEKEGLSWEKFLNDIVC